MKFEWENIFKMDEKFFDKSIVAVTNRAKVIGGWIIKNETYIFDGSSDSLAQSMTFAPDPNHEWSIE